MGPHPDYPCDYIRPKLTFVVIVDLNHTLTTLLRSSHSHSHINKVFLLQRVELLNTCQSEPFSNQILNDIDPRLCICSHQLFPECHQNLTGFNLRPLRAVIMGLISSPGLTSNEIFQSSGERFRELAMISFVCSDTEGISERNSIRGHQQSHNKLNISPWAG